MRKSRAPVLYVIACLLMFCGCQEMTKGRSIGPSDDEISAVQKASAYKDPVDLGHPIFIRPRKLSGGGDVTNHPCLKGQYYHRFVLGSEVWLCCIPVNELLIESFKCADPIPGLDYSSAYMKVRFCNLQHPTSSEPQFCPVCIPAPLKASSPK